MLPIFCLSNIFSFCTARWVHLVRLISWLLPFTFAWSVSICGVTVWCGGGEGSSPSQRKQSVGKTSGAASNLGGVDGWEWREAEVLEHSLLRSWCFRNLETIRQILNWIPYIWQDVLQLHYSLLVIFASKKKLFISPCTLQTKHGIINKPSCVRSVTVFWVLILLYHINIIN